MAGRNFAAIGAMLGRAIGTDCARAPASAVRGGCIGECWRWASAEGDLFVKLAPLADLDMLEAEAAGLDELREAAALRTPQVRAIGSVRTSASEAGVAFLALEWIEQGVADATTEVRLGEALAVQHRRAASRFGWRRDGYIGRTPQPNGWMPDWVSFLRERRLRFQIELAEGRGLRIGARDRTQLLLECLEQFFSGYAPEPSLLHGDLWGGNWLADRLGEPVVFDPAVYYGDREADIAMTRLFGGFSIRFYQAYEACWPPDAGADARRGLYDLYHLLNHANLFGGSYVGQSRALIDRLLAEVGH